jgi:hypothetical protein
MNFQVYEELLPHILLYTPDTLLLGSSSSGEY